MLSLCQELEHKITHKIIRELVCVHMHEGLNETFQLVEIINIVEIFLFVF